MIVSVAGHGVQSLRLVVPHTGAWFADVVFAEAPDVSGRVDIRLGGTTLYGTVDARQDGTRGVQRRCRIVAGAGAWGRSLAPKAYHNDAKVKALLVAQDAAREVGERLGGFMPGEDRVGSYYVRQAGPASRTLERAAGGRPWWVDYDGVTHVGARPSPAVPAGAVEVVDYDALAQVVTLHCDDISQIPVGAVLSEGLDEPKTIRDLEVDITEEQAVIRAWVGGDEISRGPILDPLRRIVESVIRERRSGAYRYRVIQMSGDRVELQIVRARTGLPNVLPVSMFPGVAGVHAELEPGAEVLVQFIDEDDAQPVVTHFAGKDGAGWIPASLNILGGTKGAARVDDEIEVTFDTGDFMLSAQAPVYNTAPLTFKGKITSGSSKVRIG